MEPSSRNTRVCCFGEILWDVLPDSRQPGGAPMNVAYHLTRLGFQAALISRVGDDVDGTQLKVLMREWGLSRALLQTDSSHDTSRVIAKQDSRKEVSYEIVLPVAWDFIENKLPAQEAAKAADYFVFGSLAARNDISKDTVFQLLEHANCKVLDVNLRPPFYSKELLEFLLFQADILKVNQAELETVVGLFGCNSPEEDEQVNRLKNKFAVTEIVVTKGAAGASYYAENETCHADGIKVKVCDTIGSGDAFLAAFIAAHSAKGSPASILQKATVMGAFIAGKKGGCPFYGLSDIQRIFQETEK